jgi:hypothetical protein
MAIKRGLGKGLNAIIGGAMLEEERHESGGMEIPLERLSANPFQPRAEFDPDKLKELADSIRLHGVLQPIVVINHCLPAWHAPVCRVHPRLTPARNRRRIGQLP